MEQSEVSERKNKESWRVSTRTDSRRGKVAECHQSTGTKELPVKENAFYYYRRLVDFFQEGN